MIKSMTGYGRGSVKSNDSQISVSLRALNSRYFDLKVNGIDLEPELELKVRRRLYDFLKRGSIQLLIENEKGKKENKDLRFNKNRYEAIDTILMSIQRNYGRRLEMSDIVTSSDLFSEGETELNPDHVLNALNLALQQVDEMRSAEGKKIQSNMEERLKTLYKKINQLESLAVKTGAERQEKYRSRISLLMDSIPVDESRLAQEIAILSDKADISEEILRCRSHIDQFRSFLKLNEPVGKRLNFLLQEMNREINTMGSKSTDITLTNLVIDLKDEAEKLREQIQNIL